MTDNEIFKKAQDSLRNEAHRIINGEATCPICGIEAATIILKTNLLGVFCVDHGASNIIEN